MPIKHQVQISLTKEQYKTLVEMINCGEWMINATRTDRIKKYEKLEQYIYSFTKEAGLQDCIDYDDELKMFFPTKEFEETSLHPFHDEYDQETFWEELIDQLAQRDLIAQFGAESFMKLPDKERSAARYEAETIYNKEFEKNGIENLVLVKPPAAPN
jgi:superfamily II DNA helicase RecQ